MSTENAQQPSTPSETPNGEDTSLIGNQTNDQQTTDQKTTEEKPVEQKTETAPEFVPLTAEDLVIPEGLTVPDEARDEFLGILNNRELSPKDQMNQLLALQHKSALAASEAGSKAWADMQETWQNEVRNDPEIGGAKLEPALGTISKLVDEYGSKELRQVFDLTGAGNNIHVIRFLAKVGSALSEGTPITGTPGGSSVPLEEKLYTTMRK